MRNQCILLLPFERNTFWEKQMAFLGLRKTFFDTVAMRVFNRAATALTVASAIVFLLVPSTAAWAQERVRVAAIHKDNDSTKLAAPARNPTSIRQSVRGQLQIVISVPDQRMDVFDGTVRVASTRISTGKRGSETPEGVFSIIQKNRVHFSNLYNNAPMPFMQRLTWSGIALHGGVVPRYPASRGCIRLPIGFAKKLFGMTDRNVQIIVNRQRQTPSTIDHDTLFQPRPRPTVSVAAGIGALTLDGLPAERLGGRDAMVLEALKAKRFAAALRAAYHPNIGAKLRAHVRLTQRLLGHLGYSVVRPDGDLGPITRRALSAFQKFQGIKQTGRPSEQTTRRLYTALGHKMLVMAADDADAILTPPAIAAPLRILITRTQAGDKIKRAQYMLTQLGYDVGGVDGAMGRKTRAAISGFRENTSLAKTATVDSELLLALVKATGGPADEDKNGRIFIRQGYRDIYEAPISISNIDAPLGTHVFTSMGFAEDRTGKVMWTALTVAEKKQKLVQASLSQTRLPFRLTDAGAALERIRIPTDVRTYIEQNLTPGSSLIVSDHGSSRETGEGTDFIVLTK